MFGDRSTKPLAAIHAEGLCKTEVLERFDCVITVADTSFQIERGELFCVVGLSGSGRSTLLRHDNRLLEPAAGEIYIGDENVIDLAPSQLSNRRVAMVFQNFGLLPHRTLRDNVAMPLEN